MQGRKLDLVGKKFGRWTIISKTPNKGYSICWLCKCECGVEKEIREWSLINGDSKSCGCFKKDNSKNNSKQIIELGKSHLKDLTGKRFGRLIVIKRMSNRGIHTYWWCKCDCDREKEICGSSLRNGYTTSCGCYRKEKTSIAVGLSSKKRVYRSYKKGSKKRNFSFELTFEQFLELTQQDCYYCGSKPFNNCNDKKSNGNFIYNGIDRIDSNKGYEIGNCVSCCRICNNAKRDLTYEKFIEWVQKISGNIKNLLRK
jgi:hypothetical protein